MMKSRVESIYSGVDDEVDAIVLVNGTEPNVDLSFFYVTGAESGIFEGCAAILWPDGGMELIVSELEETSSRRVDAEISTFRTKEEWSELLGKKLSTAGKVGLNDSAITLGNFRRVKEACPGIEEVNVSKAIEDARLIKDEMELDRLREACRIASLVADDIPNFLKEGMSESEAAAEISFRMQRLGANGNSFEIIAAFGESSAEPHYSASDKALSRGETALFDFGALYRKYCSDITRTFFARTPSERMERIYEVVKEANERAISEIRAGMPASDVDAIARDIIDATEFKGGFIHSLGHGIGLSVHDGGSLSPVTDMVLKENMVLTVEPGIYIPGEGGVRIEDDVRITKDGCEVLTSASKDLVVI
jgi:Xaa-Pro dipeptidase